MWEKCSRKHYCPRWSTHPSFSGSTIEPKNKLVHLHIRNILNKNTLKMLVSGWFFFLCVTVYPLEAIMSDEGFILFYTLRGYGQSW